MEGYKKKTKMDEIHELKDLQNQLLGRLQKVESEIDNLRKESADFQARKDILEEWLTEYRDQLKKENVYHKNQGIINAINELLNENN